MTILLFFDGVALGGGAFGSNAALGCDSWWWRQRLLATLWPSAALLLEGAMLAVLVCSDKMLFQEETNFNLLEALEEFRTT